MVDGKFADMMMLPSNLRINPTGCESILQGVNQSYRVIPLKYLLVSRWLTTFQATRAKIVVSESDGDLEKFH